MSLERADSISPENCAAQYKRANSMLKTRDSESGISSDTDSESGAEHNSKILIDLQKLPAGQYEYYTDTSSIMNQMLLYMYHTIQNIVNIPDIEDNGNGNGNGCDGPSEPTTTTIPLKLRRRPYKYDKEDFCYVQIGYGTYKYTYTVPASKTEPEKSAEFVISYRQQDKIVVTSDAPAKFEFMTIRTDSPVVFHHFYRESDNFLENNEHDDTKLHVYVMTKFGEWLRYNKIPSRTLDTVYFDEKLKQKMRADIMDFLKKEKEYDEFGIPYKKNYLLTGIPGSGKTSIIKAMCKEIGYNLCIFSINHDTDNNTALSAFRDIPPKSVLLFEDIDCLFDKRTGTQENKSTFTFSNLLNLLDGVFFRKGLISFITTNHPESLDHALLRQGRTDMIIHMNYPKKVDIKHLFRDMMRKEEMTPEEIDREFDRFYELIHKKTITMAGIVGFLFRYRKTWAENINELLDADKFIKEVTRNVEDSKLYS
jgi:ATP-dependent 26S proteasome regulatory subunit